jgi:iron complex outermembrane receptor protein
MRRELTTAVSLAALTAALAFATVASAEGADAKSSSDVSEVIVTAQQARKQVESNGSVGVLGAQDALSTPFNVTTYTSKLILDQQSETIGAVLQNDPAVRLTFGGGNQSEMFVIRGFALFGDDIAFDGLYGVVPRQLVSPELFESVQVLNGASAFLYGAAPGGSGVGGGVDLIPKRATKRLFRATAGYIEQNIFGGALDVADRFGADEALGARFNTVYRSGDSAIRGEHRDVQADSLDFDWTHGPVRAFLDVGYEDQEALRPRPEVRLATGIAVPSAPNPRSNYGQPWTYTKLQDLFAVSRIEVDVTKNVQFYAAGGFRRGKEVGDYSTVTVTNAVTGAATGSRLFVPRNDRNESGLVGLHAHFDTGPLTNQVNLGFSGVREENFNAFTFGSFPAPFAASATGFFSNIYNPPTVPPPTNSTLPSAGGSLIDLPLLNRTNFMSSFISDTIGAFDDRALLTVGVRRQNIDMKGFNRGTHLQTSSYNNWATTPVVGLVLKANDHVSVYANRIEALVQGPIAPISATTVNPGEVFAPFVSVQYEAGLKVAYRGLTATLAAYQIKQPSAFAAPVPGSTTLTRFGVDGEQTNKGIEFTLNGEPTDYLRFIGGFSINDAKLTKTAGGLSDGKRAIGVPDYQANVGVEFNPPMMRKAVFTARWLTTGSQYVDVGNTQKVSSWNRLDIGARYVAVIDAHPVTFRATLENVTDNSFWESAFGGYLVLGEPRTAKASVTFEY